MPNVEDIREGTVKRIQHLCDAMQGLSNARRLIEHAGGSVQQAWKGWGGDTIDLQRNFVAAKTQGSDALVTFTEMVGDDINSDLHAAAQQLGMLVARDVIAPIVQESNDPVVELTGNRMMPPLRNFDDAESVWTADDTGDIWEAFCEAVDSKLKELDIDTGCPDYDNAMYGVDGKRWRFIHPVEDDANAWLDSKNYEAIRD